MSFWSTNILPRLRLMRIALFRRFIYNDLITLVTDYGVPYNDVYGNIGPFDVAKGYGFKSNNPKTLAFESIEPPESFTPDFSEINVNSESSVARFLGQLVFCRDAKIVIELGCFVGWTTAHMALAMKTAGTGVIHCVDASQQYLDILTKNLDRHELGEYVKTINGFSMQKDVLESLPASVDVIFIDTSHTYPATRDEILEYEKRLAPGGCLVLHDSINTPGVRRSIFELRDKFLIHTFATERSNGLTLLLQK
jgi:predicted O-methyltransferase YrrM